MQFVILCVYVARLQLATVPALFHAWWLAWWWCNLLRQRTQTNHTENEKVSFSFLIRSCGHIDSQLCKSHLFVSALNSQCIIAIAWLLSLNIQWIEIYLYYKHLGAILRVTFGLSSKKASKYHLILLNSSINKLFSKC